MLRGMHGRNYMEIVHLMRDGLAPLDAWYAATGAPASEIGQDDAGVLAPGRRADLLLCRDDVLEDPEKLAEGAIVEVIKDGVGHRGAFAELPQRSFESTVQTALSGD